jgi:acetoin utilization deacetylase AcuC-like enzyme
MKIIYNKVFLEHDTGMHPENKKRLECLGKLKETKISDNKKDLSLIHSKHYAQQVREACRKGGYLDPDTCVSPGSYDAAVAAVNATILASQTDGFALVRPPGHHAHPGRSSGFCVFNNLAVSAQKLVDEGKKVLIFDFDGHLGDGTMDIFYDTDKVLYFSAHQYPAFPGKGWVDETGKGNGKGYTINMPLPPGTADDLYFDAINKTLPYLKKFDADAVAISAGFDAYKDDLLLDLKLSYNAYHRIGGILRDNFQNMYATFEGGYNTSALKACVMNFLDGINGKKQKYSDAGTKSSAEVKKEYNKRIKELMKNLKFS